MKLHWQIHENIPKVLNSIESLTTETNGGVSGENCRNRLMNLFPNSYISSISSFSQTDDTPSFKCCKCDERFVSDADLNTHLSTHAVPRRNEYECGQCGKKFRSSAALAVRNMTHICSLCHVLIIPLTN